MSTKINGTDLLRQAADLATTDGDDNPEYDRALTELCTNALGLSQDDKETIHRLITGRNLA
jgi:hypothetical protein